MGVLARLFSIKIKMRAFAFVLLSLAAVQADSNADAYTIGKVASGHTNGGVVTGVDYGHGLVQGLGAIGNRAYAGYAGVGHLGYAGHAVAALLLMDMVVWDMLDTMASVRLKLTLMLTLLP